MIHGAQVPLFSVVFGTITDEFSPENTPQEIKDTAKKVATKILAFGLLAFVFATIGVQFWRWLGAWVSVGVKKTYYSKLVNTDIGFFDVKNPEKLTTAYAEEMAAFVKGSGTSFHVFFFSMSMSLSGFFIGFFYGWKYSLYILLSLPVMFIGMGIFMSIIQKSATVTKESYAQAGQIAEQCLNSVKTVYSLNGQEHELKNYKATIAPAMKIAIKFGLVAGIAYGIFFFSFLAEYGLGYYIGALLVKNKKWNDNSQSAYRPSDVVAIFFAITTGAFSMG